MNDTQWRRFQVFLQVKEGEPHLDAGSVHAPDAELALLNARDVFVRRPECVSLWVVPANEIYSKTAEEIKEQGSGDKERRLGAGEQGKENFSSADGMAVELYDVFCKMKPAGTQSMVGQVEAGTPAEAMEKAVKQFSIGRTKAGVGRLPALAPYVWWVFPDRAVMRSSPQEVQSMFAPAWNKPFRLSTDFRTLTAMREIKKVDPQPKEADRPEPGSSGSTTSVR
jgi:ring-1,2-phenylacetyl-CoA epoxidase subunit PaaB